MRLLTVHKGFGWVMRVVYIMYGKYNVRIIVCIVCIITVGAFGPPAWWHMAALVSSEDASFICKNTRY